MVGIEAWRLYYWTKLWGYATRFLVSTPYWVGKSEYLLIPWLESKCGVGYTWNRVVGAMFCAYLLIMFNYFWRIIWLLMHAELDRLVEWVSLAAGDRWGTSYRCPKPRSVGARDPAIGSRLWIGIGSTSIGRTIRLCISQTSLLMLIY